LLEKEAQDSVKVIRLESNALKVIRRDWSQHITEELRTGTQNTFLSVVGLYCMHHTELLHKTPITKSYCYVLLIKYYLVHIIRTGLLCVRSEKI